MVVCIGACMIRLTTQKMELSNMWGVFLFFVFLTLIVLSHLTCGFNSKQAFFFTLFFFFILCA